MKCSIAEIAPSRRRIHHPCRNFGQLGWSPSTRLKARSIRSVYGAVSMPTSSRCSSTFVWAHACQDSWPMNGPIASRSSGSSTCSLARLMEAANHRSPVGSSRCSTFSTWELKGSPGIHCAGVSDQSKRTCRRSEGCPS